jgi:hypothetical protein
MHATNDVLLELEDTITPLGIDDLVEHAPAGSPFVAMLVDLLRALWQPSSEDARGGTSLATLTAREHEDTCERLAAAQARFLLGADTPDRYYARAFGRLGLLEPGDRIAPSLLLEHLCYPARDLVAGRAQKLRLTSAGLEGGRVFSSSGTTNPSNRKRIYYDAITAVLLREANNLGWAATTGHAFHRGDRALLLMPPETRIGMPFASMVADMLAGHGTKIYWGARFIHPPEIVLDDVFQVPTAQLDFKDNVRPAKAAIARFGVASHRHRGVSVVMGLLPSLHAMLQASEELPGLLRKLAGPRPSIVAFGGGLKHMGIPPSPRARGGPELDAYLARVAEVTDVSRSELAAMLERPERAGTLDELLTAFLVHEVGRLCGGCCYDIYAGAEIQPCLFPAGTREDLYGEGWARVRGETPPPDVFVPVPGVVVELRDPLDGERIAPSELERPGILRLWNPYNISHLHVIESEDLLAWTPIPERAPFRPAYTEGVGLRFVGRAVTGGTGGYCAS